MIPAGIEQFLGSAMLCRELPCVRPRPDASSGPVEILVKTTELCIISPEYKVRSFS